MEKDEIRYCNFWEEAEVGMKTIFFVGEKLREFIYELYTGSRSRTSILKTLKFRRENRERRFPLSNWIQRDKIETKLSLLH